MKCLFNHIIFYVDVRLQYAYNETKRFMATRFEQDYKVLDRDSTFYIWVAMTLMHKMTSPWLLVNIAKII